MTETLSTFAIAKMLHVDPSSVVNWIDQGLLKAHRTPGGHRRVTNENLARFLREHDMPIPNELHSPPARILVVDDEQAITRLIAQAINSAHPEYEVVEAHDGFAAGSVLATVKPDVVVLDLCMPGMDGYEVCRMIKARDDTKHAHIIAITAYHSAENARRIKECGASICLSKPLDMAELVRQITSVIEGPQAL